jgi:hypothetical protein
MLRDVTDNPLCSYNMLRTVTWCYRVSHYLHARGSEVRVLYRPQLYLYDGYNEGA